MTDFSMCTPKTELEKLSKEELIEIIMKQERDCTRLTAQVAELENYKRWYNTLPNGRQIARTITSSKKR